MADLTNINWIYPPNFTGTYEAGTKNGHRRHIVLCTCISDGTGEDDAIKLKRTDMLTSDGEIPSKLVIERIDYQINGMIVKIGYNNVDDVLVAALYSGDGYMDFTKVGGFTPQDDVDNEGGDIVFTTENCSDGDTYTITLQVRLKQ